MDELITYFGILLPHLAFKNALVKPFEEFRVFESEALLLLVLVSYNEAALSFTTIHVCRFISGIWPGMIVITCMSSYNGRSW